MREFIFAQLSSGNLNFNQAPVRMLLTGDDKEMHTFVMQYTKLLDLKDFNLQNEPDFNHPDFLTIDQNMDIRIYLIPSN